MIVAALMGDPERVDSDAGTGALSSDVRRVRQRAATRSLDVRLARVARRGTLPASLRRTLLPVRNTRTIGKRDMVLNDALPKIEIDAERYTVTIDGERIEPRAAASLPLAQRYFLVLSDAANGVDWIARPR